MKRLLKNIGCILLVLSIPQGLLTAQISKGGNLETDAELQAVTDYWDKFYDEKYLSKGVPRHELEGTGYYPYIRMKSFYERRKTEDGGNPFLDRWAIYQALKTNEPANSRNNTPAANWENLGPNLLGDFSGRMLSIDFDPQDSLCIWAGSAEGGLWNSTDGGASWKPMTDYLPAIGVSAVVVNPKNPNEILIGTGEGKAVTLTFKPGIGVLKSFDKGQTWVETSLNFSQNNGVSTYHMVWNPEDTNIVYLGATNGLWISYDGGMNWTQKFTNRTTSVILNKQSPNVAYVAVQGNGIYKSVDDGQTWTRLLNGLPATSIQGLTSLAISDNYPDVLLAAVTHATTSLIQGVYKSSDAGQTWSQLPNVPAYMLGFLGIGQGWYNNEIAISPIDTNLIILGGVTLWKSSDGGQTWLQKDISATNLSGAGTPWVDQHEIDFSPYDANTIWLANDGGIAKSENLGDFWQRKNKDLITAQFYKLASSRTDVNFLIGGLQDHGLGRIPNASQNLGWDIWSTGDGVSVNIDHQNPNIIYGDLIFGAHFKSVTGGANVATTFAINTGIPASETAPLFTPTVMDPVDSKVLYTSTNTNVYKTTNGAVWQRLKSIPFVQCLAVSPLNNQIVYAAAWNPATTFNEFWYSQDAGATWTKAANSPGWRVVDVEADPKEASIVYITRRGTTNLQPQVLKSEDYGNTWTDISNNLPNVSINALTINAYNNQHLYVATDLGVWASCDGGKEWFEFNDNLPIVYSLDLHFHPADTTIRVGTHGRGVWRTKAMPTFLTSISYPIELADFQVLNAYPNPFKTTTFFEVEMKNSGKLKLDIYNGNGQRVYTTQENLSSGKHTILWTGQTATNIVVPTGIYWAKIQVNGFAQTIKLIKS